MGDTIFGKIIRREIPADIVYETDDVLAFRDLNPQAPVHVLFIPKRAIATLNDAVAADAELLGKLLLAAADYAKREGFDKDGYRTVDQLQRTWWADGIPPARASAGRAPDDLAAGLIKSGTEKNAG